MLCDSNNHRIVKGVQSIELYWLSKAEWGHILKSCAEGQWGEEMYIDSRKFFALNIGVDW